MSEIGDIIEGHIDSLAFGGEGILRHGGKVVFVPFTAPGDYVRVRVERDQKSFAHAVVLEVIEPSPQRIAPRCPYFGTCGGCTLQHVQYQEQLRQKSHFVTDALQRIGKVPVTEAFPIVPCNDVWAYRRHIRLNLRKAETGFVAGYVSFDNHTLVEIQQCAIFVGSEEFLLRDIQSFLRHLPSDGIDKASLSIVKASPGRFVLAFHIAGLASDQFESWLRELLGLHEKVSGIIIEDGRGTREMGDTACQFDVDGLNIMFSPLAFVQSHPEQSIQLYREVLRLAQLCGAKSVLDLYCGIGVTSLLLGRAGMAVTGVEGNPVAVGLAVANANANTIHGVQFKTGDVARHIRQLLKKKPDVVLINPPRTGIDPTTRDAIAKMGPKHLIYVSCMPSTLARDVAAFSIDGYRLSSCYAYDMFPQTTHVESVVLLQRDDL